MSKSDPVTSPRRKMVLVGNYLPDAQQSMLRFGDLLAERLRGREWDVVNVRPRAVAGRAKRGRAPSKWLGYVDKYVLFPRALRRQVDGAALVHIVDHSNAVYVPTGPSACPWVVTCHDLLAVRGALGEDTDCPASPMGRQLQRAIVRGLSRAAAIACDSASTAQDVARLVPLHRPQRRRVIHLGLNHPYRAISPAEAAGRLAAMNDVPWTQPFVVHVGSNLARKNKAGVLRVFARHAARWPGNLIFCGAPLTAELRAQAAAAGVASRVFAAPSPDNAQLEAIYSLAYALLYPSRCEGFGWPVIEAQACGCPVVCSDRTSLPEIGGAAALVHALDDEAGMADSLRKLEEPAFRATVVARGFANLERFSTDGMIDAYGALYEEVLAARPR